MKLAIAHLTAVLMLLAACASGTLPDPALSAQNRCLRDGGTWYGGLGLCEMYGVR